MPPPRELCMVPVSGLQQTLFCQPPNSLHHSQPGHMGLWEAAPKSSSPWGQAENLLVQVPLNIPVRNHVQPCNACQGADCCQRLFKLWFPHPMGLCWHDATSSWPSWQPRGVQSFSVHGSQKSTRTGDLQNVSAASPQLQQSWKNKRGLLTHPQEFKPAPGPLK